MHKQQQKYFKLNLKLMNPNLLKLGGTILMITFLFNSCSDSSDETDPCQNGPELSVDNVTISIEGQSTGEISVSASSGKSPYMFSIDGMNFQNNGSFSNLSGGDYTVAVKDANNCTDSKMATVLEVPEVSYADQIRPIIDTNCQISNCHGDKAGIPSWASYADVKAKAEEIKFRTSSGSMPPTGSLPDAEIKLIADWVDQGAPDN
jgi:hypothetical protein